MDIRSLHYFVNVYEKQSFSKAAKACFVAQPSISSAVSQLEKTLSSPLFTRHARGVTPTTEGVTLYPLAKKIIGQADAIKSVFLQKTDNISFHLGVTKGLGVERMSALLKDFITAIPEMELTLVPHNIKSDARIIIKEELDENEKYLSLWQEQYLLAVPHHHPLALKGEVSLVDFDQLPFIQRSPCSAWNDVNDTLTLSGISVDIRAKIQTIDYALGLVRAGLGCALVPAHAEVLSKKDIAFLPLSTMKLTREIVVAYQNQCPIIDTLKGLIAKHQQ